MCYSRDNLVHNSKGKLMATYHVKKNCKINAKTVRLIKEHVEAGDPIGYIAGLLNVSPSTVFSVKRNGYSLSKYKDWVHKRNIVARAPKKSHGVTQEIVDRSLRMHREGKTNHYIAMMVGVSDTTMTDIIRSGGNLAKYRSLVMEKSDKSKKKNRISQVIVYRERYFFGLCSRLVKEVPVSDGYSEVYRWNKYANVWDFTDIKKK